MASYLSGLRGTIGLNITIKSWKCPTIIFDMKPCQFGEPFESTGEYLVSIYFDIIYGIGSLSF